MSFFKEAGDSLLRYTEKIVSKTEVYAKIGKITLDIRKLESQIQKAQREMGEYAYAKFSEGAQSLAADDSLVKDKCEFITGNRAQIEQKRREIDEIRTAGQGGSAGSGAPSSGGGSADGHSA
ncbi:MAG: hypothetical protein KBA61_09355 [Spirochaetes bacterium]|nr:hypothetical protein [Spirochaetota bacterium]